MVMIPNAEHKCNLIIHHGAESACVDDGGRLLNVARSGYGFP